MSIFLNIFKDEKDKLPDGRRFVYVFASALLVLAVAMQAAHFSVGAGLKGPFLAGLCLVLVIFIANYRGYVTFACTLLSVGIVFLVLNNAFRVLGLFSPGTSYVVFAIVMAGFVSGLRSSVFVACVASAGMGFLYWKMQLPDFRLQDARSSEAGLVYQLGAIWTAVILGSIVSRGYTLRRLRDLAATEAVWKEKYESLMASERGWRDFLDPLACSIVVVDSIARRFIYANQAAASLFGLSPGALLKINPDTLFAHDSIESYVHAKDDSWRKWSNGCEAAEFAGPDRVRFSASLRCVNFDVRHPGYVLCEFLPIVKWD